MSYQDFTERLNFADKGPDHAQKLHNRGRDRGYYYDNLCCYCANNDVDLTYISDDDFSAAADIMAMHGTSDLSTDHYYFWIDE